MSARTRSAAEAHAQRSDALAVSLDEDPRTPLYQLRDSDSRHQEVRSLNFRLQIPRSGMAHDDGGVPCQQELGHRLADDV